MTTIALPHDWCNYGGVIEGFKAKYGIEVNELNPDAGSADELEAIRANKDNKGPQAPDVIDVGFSFGPAAKDEGLIQPYKVSTWDDIPDNVKDAEGYWYGDYYGVLSFAVNKDLVPRPPRRLGRPAEARVRQRGGAGRRPARLEPGDPRRLRRRPRRRRRAGRRRRQEGPRLLRRAEQGRQLRAGHRQVRHARPGRDAASSSGGTTTRSPAATR